MENVLFHALISLIIRFIESAAEKAWDASLQDRKIMQLYKKILKRYPALKNNNWAGIYTYAVVEFSLTLKNLNKYDVPLIEMILTFLTDESVRDALDNSLNSNQNGDFETNIRYISDALKKGEDLKKANIDIVSLTLLFRETLISILKSRLNQKDKVMLLFFGERIDIVRDELQHKLLFLESRLNVVEEKLVANKQIQLFKALPPSGLYLFDTLKPEGGKIGKIAWGNIINYISIPCEKGFVGLWEFDEKFSNKGIYKPPFSTNNQPATCSSWFPYDLDSFAAGTSKSNIFIFSNLSNKALEYKGHQGPITSIAWFRDNHGPKIASSSNDNTVRFWNMNNKEEEDKLEFTESVECFVFGHYQLITAHKSGKIKYWNNNTNNKWLPDPRFPELANSCSILSIAYTYYENEKINGKIEQIVASGDINGDVKIWDVNKGEFLTVIPKVHHAPVVGLSFSKDSMLLASKTKDGLVTIWQANSKKDWRLVWYAYDYCSDSEIASVAFNPSHHDILATTGEGDTVVKVWKISRDVLNDNDSTKVIRTLRKITSGEADWPTENAQKLAEYLCEHSENGILHDKMFTKNELSAILSLNINDIDEIVAELQENRLVIYQKHATRLWANNCLFWKFDKIVMGWETVEDAVVIAKILLKCQSEAMNLDQIKDLLNWELRRVNPAVTFLVENKYVDKNELDKGSYPHAYRWIKKNASTSRFVKKFSPS